LGHLTFCIARDRKSTINLVKAGEILGIEVIDHIIVAHDLESGLNFLSMRLEGLIIKDDLAA
jgi:DNA repair protein RadC